MQPLRNAEVENHIARLAGSYRDLFRKQILDRRALQNRPSRKVGLRMYKQDRHPQDKSRHNPNSTVHSEHQFLPFSAHMPLTR